MALSNYTELLDEITVHANRAGDADFTAAVPSFVTLAHSRINRELRCRQMVKSATITLTDGVGDLPEDYLEFIEVRAGAIVLAAVEPNFGDYSYPHGGGCATYFAIVGETIKTWPAAGSVSLSYYGEIEHPDEADDDTNWLLKKCPGIYLYGSLIEASVFMGDDGRVSTWGTMYERLRDSLQTEDVVSRFARASSRVRGPTP
jgi:hypothetical protein